MARWHDDGYIARYRMLLKLVISGGVLTSIRKRRQETTSTWGVVESAVHRSAGYGPADCVVVRQKNRAGEALHFEPALSQCPEKGTSRVSRFRKECFSLNNCRATPGAGTKKYAETHSPALQQSIQHEAMNNPTETPVSWDALSLLPGSGGGRPWPRGRH